MHIIITARYLVTIVVKIKNKIGFHFLFTFGNKILKKIKKIW